MFLSSCGLRGGGKRASKKNSDKFKSTFYFCGIRHKTRSSSSPEVYQLQAVHLPAVCDCKTFYTSNRSSTDISSTGYGIRHKTRSSSSPRRSISYRLFISRLYASAKLFTPRTDHLQIDHPMNISSIDHLQIIPPLHDLVDISRQTDHHLDLVRFSSCCRQIYVKCPFRRWARSVPCKILHGNL